MHATFQYVYCEFRCAEVGWRAKCSGVLRHPEWATPPRVGDRTASLRRRDDLSSDSACFATASCRVIRRFCADTRMFCCSRRGTRCLGHAVRMASQMLARGLMANTIEARSRVLNQFV